MESANWGTVLALVIGAIGGTGGLAFTLFKYWTDKQKQDYEGKLNLATQEADFQIKRQEQLFNQMIVSLKQAQDECQRLRQMIYHLEEKQDEPKRNEPFAR